MAYVDALGGRAQLSSGAFPTRRLALVGDFNQEQAPTDVLLKPRGFAHANDVLAARGDARSIARAGAANVDTSIIGQHRIDHPYLRGATPTDSAVGAVESHAYPGVATDHLGLVVDLP